jgi:two-component system sensor histidine kinase HydH
MSAVLAHEIRNPLASLKGHAQLLVEELRAEVPPEPARSRARAERVVAEAVRIEQLCGGLLEFVRTGAIARAPVDPGQLARAAIAEIGVPIALELAEAPARWSLDAGRMQQVLCNLLRNAVESSPEPGTVLLRVRSGRDRLCFEVCDRGPGVPEAARERIFAPFVTGRTRGTGLGLTVARRIVEAHGGDLSVTDRAGGGAVFTATIAPGES